MIDRITHFIENKNVGLKKKVNAHKIHRNNSVVIPSKIQYVHLEMNNQIDSHDWKF